MLTRLDFTKQAPQEERHTRQLNKAQHRVICGSGELVTLRGAHPQRGVLPGVEQDRRAHGSTKTVEDLEVDRSV